jgi:hypothetical protein
MARAWLSDGSYTLNRTVPGGTFRMGSDQHYPETPTGDIPMASTARSTSTNINTNNWTHNPAHRQGVRYNNVNVAAKFGIAPTLPAMRKTGWISKVDVTEGK